MTMTNPIDDKYSIDTYEQDTHLGMLKKFANFWSNVSKIHIGRQVSRDTAGTIVSAMEHVQPNRTRRGQDGNT